LRGRNTEVRLTFVRHSQKASGRIFAQDLGGISVSSISEAGKARARAFGRAELTGRTFNKAYATKVDRTRETLESAFQGAGLEAKILQDGKEARAFFTLPSADWNKEFIEQYDAKMEPRRAEYLTTHFPDKKFNELTPDEQETVAEYAEEPAMEWYLSFEDKRPDPNTLSPREDAAKVAFKINRLINLPDFMPEGKSVDLVSSGHKTSTEAFLKYVIQREVDGRKVTGFERLEEIGGSLKILDSWDLEVKKDSHGVKTATITLRRENGETQRFDLNFQALRALAREGAKLLGVKGKKIDQLRG